MKLRWNRLVCKLLAVGSLAGWAATAGASPQQTPAFGSAPEVISPQKPVSRPEEAEPVQPRQLRPLYENIEIYRRLLLKALVSHLQVARSQVVPAEKKNGQKDSPYGAPIAASAYFAGGYDPNGGHPDVHAGLGISHSSVEGVFLPRVGILFSAELDIDLPVLDKPSRPEPKPLSDWERARREWRGDKIDKSEERQPQPPPSILDTVLHSLAANGHHLSGLSPTEQVSVVLTFRGARTQNCASCHIVSARNYWNSQTGSAAGSFQTGASFTTPNNVSTPRASYFPQTIEDIYPSSTKPSGQQGQPSSTNSPNQLNRDDSNNRVLLGDLHLKQGRYEEALSTYTKAAEDYHRWAPASSTTPKSDLEAKRREVVMTLLELQNKIIQCHMALKQEDKVQEGVQTLKRLMSKFEQLDVKPDATKSGEKVAAANKEPMLPTKVIITAPKPLLDQAGKGQITFEEFKKQVKVDVLRFEDSDW